MILKKVLFVSVCLTLAAAVFITSANAQSRERVVKATSSQPVNQPPNNGEPAAKTTRTTVSRPTLSSPIIVVNQPAANKPLVQRTGSSKPVYAPPTVSAGKTVYNADTSARLMAGIKARYGIPYHYGSTGPNTYDCSGFVWSVFQEAGVNFTRSSARSLWESSEPVYGDDRFKFGTLVFFNNLGHMGIVADENGFYQASSSKGITYSPFAGYWSGRIVGFRRLKQQSAMPASEK